MNFATIEEGRFHLELDDGSKHEFQINDDGQHQLRDLLKERGIEDMMCSSSVDFPTEYGGPEIDVREWIDKALAIPPMEFGVSVLKSLISRLEKGDVEEVTAKLKNWVKTHEGIYGE